MECLFVIFMLSCLLVKVNSQSVPNSPCPQVFRYVNDGNNIYGVFKIFPPYKSNLFVKVKMDIAGVMSTQNSGKIDLIDKSALFKSITSGESIEYRITFPESWNIPVITSIEINERVICSGPRVSTLPRLTIDLTNTLRTNVGNPYTGVIKPVNDGIKPVNNNYYNGQNINVIPTNNRPPTFQNQIAATNQDSYQANPWLQGVYNNGIPIPATTEYTTRRPITSSRRPTTTTRRPVLDNGSAICGISRKKTNELVLRGDTTSKGDWPWLSALFLNEIGTLSFMCGGSLISRDIVLTAGHCLVRRNYDPIDKENFIVMLGLYNVQDWTSEETLRTVLDDIVFHPSFEAGVNLKNDIAILKLRTKPTFSDYIIPVCLWTSNLNILQIYGRYGSIVGWGRDENGLTVTPEPRLTRQRIVTTDQCRDSNPDFNSLTSDTTICAGNRNGTGPCNGDSGGGMYLRISGRWILRGIVSTTISSPEASNCNLNDFVIYTDVSKYTAWINEHLFN